jgi:membrane fusion protein, copper/silver efflux system
MYRLVLLAAIFSLCVACGTEEVSPALAHYVAAQEALAGDDYAGAKKALGQLAQTATPSLKTLAEQAASAGDIEAVRAVFKPLSEELRKDEVPEGYVLAYCPMADGNEGAHWIQKDGPSIMNPYFGASMLHCGVFKD